MLRLLFTILLVVSSNAYAAKKCGVIDTICTAGPTTVVVDGMEFTRPCAEQAMRFACIDDEVTATECASPIEKKCKLVSTTCEQNLKINGVSQCITEQREYSCKVAEETTSTRVNCGSQEFCVEGNCFDTGSIPDPDFAMAVSSLEAAREGGVYIDEDTFQLFKGQDNRCSKNVLLNCCRTTGKPTKGLTNLALVSSGCKLIQAAIEN